MPTPAWLRTYWNERLGPDLKNWEMAQGEPETLKTLFLQMLDDWKENRKKPLSDYSVATYVTQTREWLSQLPLTESNSVQTASGAQHVALTYFNFEASHWAELTMRSQGKVEQRNQHLLS